MKGVARKSIAVLVGICLFIALSMAAVNMITAPRIAEQEEIAKKNALNAVLPENEDFDLFKPTEAQQQTIPECVKEIWVDKDGDGVVAILSVKGYDSSKPMSIAVGFSSLGSIDKVVIISANGETSGIGTKVKNSDFIAQFDGKDNELVGVDTISGATVSSSAVINAVKDSFIVCELIKGES